MKRNLLMVAPLMLAMSMWVYGQTGSMGGSQGGNGGQGGQGQATGGATGGASGAQNGQPGEPGQNSPATQGDVTNGKGTGVGSDNQANNTASNSGGGKTLKGCIRSENGQYLLEEKGGKMASLSAGSDLAAHVGHQVKVHGNWEKGSSAASARANGANTPSADTGTVASGTEPNGNTNAAANTGARAQASGSASDSNSGSTSSGSAQASDNAGRKMDHAGKTFQVAAVDMVSETCSINGGKSSNNSNSNYGSQAGSPQSGSSSQSGTSSPSGQPPRK
jgi:hypothetical protein